MHRPFSNEHQFEVLALRVFSNNFPYNWSIIFIIASELYRGSSSLPAAPIRQCCSRSRYRRLRCFANSFSLLPASSRSHEASLPHGRPNSCSGPSEGGFRHQADGFAVAASSTGVNRQGSRVCAVQRLHAQGRTVSISSFRTYFF